MANTWEETFSEMKKHKCPLKSTSQSANTNMGAFGIPRQDIGDDEDFGTQQDTKDAKKHAYMAILKCGQKRDRCSYNSAMNYMFQAEVAVGAKLAGWNLVYHGYGDRLCAFIHDEYVYWLWPHEVKTHIPIIEKLMLQGMCSIITDVKVGVESSCMLHWDKKATEFTKLSFDDNGLPILEEPPFVKELLSQTT